mmetsp:Transcript_16926/g.41966  ORF Transcript_16926/g.41966 Transcript_16926/m.41966 type:complete len:146 (-) Transcript_16926:493-930(-)
MAFFGPKNVYTPSTLVGNWQDDRMDKWFQEKQRYAKVYALPSRGSTGWSKTSDAIGDTMKDEMTKKSTIVREMDAVGLRSFVLPPDEMYATTQKREFANPDDRAALPVHHIEDGFDKEWLREYRKTWTHADGFLYTRKGPGQALA